MQKMAIVAVLAVALGAGLLLVGCEGGNGDGGIVVLPQFLGQWLGVAFDSENAPLGASVFQVGLDGDIVAEVDGVPTVVGALTSSSGGFVGAATIGGVRATFRGDLNTDDTGMGTWQMGPATGTLRLWRANRGQAFTLNVTVQGDRTGGGQVTATTVGVITGAITVAGVPSGEVHGVATASGEVVLGWGGGTGVPYVHIFGDLTPTGASGAWEATNGETGTWTATFQ